MEHDHVSIFISISYKRTQINLPEFLLSNYVPEQAARPIFPQCFPQRDGSFSGRHSLVFPLRFIHISVLLRVLPRSQHALFSSPSRWHADRAKHEPARTEVRATIRILHVLRSPQFGTAALAATQMDRQLTPATPEASTQPATDTTG